MPTVIRRVIPATTVGAYLVRGSESGQPAPLLVGFHGYGGSAEGCLEDLERIPGSEDLVIAAVQALHRFYDRKHDAVVGSWMTRLDREQAIADNERYVASVVAALRADVEQDGRVVYLGFSQGAAMAYRAAARGASRAAGVIALGGDVPPDVSDDPGVELPPVLIGRGRDDDWYTEEKVAQDLTRLRARHAAVEHVRFEGGHEWTEAFRETAGKFLRRVVPLSGRGQSSGVTGPRP
jgi:predicted esterase